MKQGLLAITYLSIVIAISIEAAKADTPAYKCQENGKITFSQLPCKNGASTAVAIKTVSPSAEEQQNAQDAHRQRLKTLSRYEKIRHQEEAKQDSLNRQLARQVANDKKHCETKQLQAKWAKEDLKNAQLKTEMKARQKLKRANEKLELACKN